MKKWITILLPLVVTAAVIPTAMGAGLSNPGFETGDLTSWTAIYPPGTVSVVTNALGWTASEGTYFALLDSGTVEHTDFTVLKQSFDMQAGDSICFDYFFQSALERSEVLARVRLLLVGDGGTTILKLKGNVDDSEIGVWETAYSDPVKDSGTYTLKFQIKNQNSCENSAVFGVDNIGINCENGNGNDNDTGNGAVPEPLTMLASFMGVVSLAGYVKKRRS